MRIDKWLWAVRLFKTRSIASEACKKNRVLINNSPVKPSKNIEVGEIIEVKNPPIIKSYKVIGIIGKRVSAKLAVENYENLTNEEEITRLKAVSNSTYIYREKGSGRPTKKERRIIDDISSKYIKDNL